MLCMPPFPGRPAPPTTPGILEWVEEGIAAPSAHFNAASPIIGTALRQRLSPRGWFARDQPCPALCIAHAPVKTRSIILLLTSSQEVTGIPEVRFLYRVCRLAPLRSARRRRRHSPECSHQLLTGTRGFAQGLCQRIA